MLHFNTVLLFSCHFSFVSLFFIPILFRFPSISFHFPSKPDIINLYNSKLAAIVTPNNLETISKNVVSLSFILVVFPQVIHEFSKHISHFPPPTSSFRGVTTQSQKCFSQFNSIFSARDFFKSVMPSVLKCCSSSIQLLSFLDITKIKTI